MRSRSPSAEAGTRRCTSRAPVQQQETVCRSPTGISLARPEAAAAPGDIHSGTAVAGVSMALNKAV